MTHWKYQALLAGQQAVQTHDRLQLEQEQNKKLETAIENLKQIKKSHTPTPKVNLERQQHAPNTDIAPGVEVEMEKGGSCKIKERIIG